MSKSSMNLQDSFLNQVRRENTEVKILLINGTTLRGIVKGFDNFTVIVANRNGQHLIYKHAIAQLVNHRPASTTPGGGRRDGEEMGIGGSDVDFTGGEAGEAAEAESGDVSGVAEGAEATQENSGTRAGAAERKNSHGSGHGGHGKGPRRDGNRDDRNRGGDRGGERENREAQQQKSRKDGFNTLDLSRVKLGGEAENTPQAKVESSS